MMASDCLLIGGGELLAGMLDKKMLGTSGGAIVHTIWLEHGPQVRSPSIFIDCLPDGL